ncbi:type VII secretion target [Actinoplanes sp. TRM 88003]|uniref:Type VII secretion target n=1 Tax=Paractinoplanes aksuensis TaxID=2939490 RepID=A0ABT1DUJ9_9ACTN|nr:type VII secretion target [Actinoplanes aksuensis]MCO8274213.1 type VII secretion target [Actinoplanes aksuensis]
MTLKAAIQALRVDAATWDETSGVLSHAAGEAGALTLTEGDLSWASRPTGLLDTYAEIQAKVAALLAQGARTHAELARTLDQVATAYERDDEEAAARLGGVWDVRD